MMEITIDDNFFAFPKSIILGNSGEVASRTINIKQPTIEKAESYLARFSVFDGMEEFVFETEILNDILTIPAVVLAKMGSGFMQWIARNKNGQLIAKSDLIAYSVLRSIGDEVSVLPAVEDTESAIDRIKKTAQEVLDAIEVLNTSGIIDEIKAARKSAFNNEIHESLNERLLADFNEVKKFLKGLDVIEPYLVIEIEKCGDDLEGDHCADGTLHITGVGDIADQAFINRDDFGALDINITGKIGIWAFAGCSHLSFAEVNCREICDGAFTGCQQLKWLTIGKSVQKIGAEILRQVGSLYDSSVRVMYAGTITEWAAIEKSANWVGEMVTIENGVVICSDGTVEA